MPKRGRFLEGSSFDTTLGQGYLYIDDAEVAYDVRNVASDGQVMDIQSAAYMVHFFGWPGGFEGEIADFWYDDSYVDLSVEANRRKFISGNGKPVSLGADGSGPTGAQPLIFFSGDATQWGTNKGRGGAFTLAGALRSGDTLAGDITAAPGDRCLDGTVYAGQSPDGNVPMFATRCDAGQSWDNNTCTGTRPYLPWNHGGAGPLADWRRVYASDAVTGLINTEILATADASTNGGQQNHLAALHCKNLEANGWSDWYLPSINELEVLAANKNQIGNFAVNYWASTEANRTEAMANDFWGAGSGNAFPIAKNSNYFVRCVRKEDPCKQPNPSPGTMCNDGTVYAGHTPDGDLPIFTTLPNLEENLPWGPYEAHRGITNGYTGRANTAALAAFGPWVHSAAYYCDTLSAHGYDDWYLPAIYELVLMRALEGTAAELDDNYWSSTEQELDPLSEHAHNRALMASMPEGSIDWYRSKQDWRRVRCVRRPGTPPADPCADTPNPGAICADGSIYAGLSPDGNKPMYMTMNHAPDRMRWGPNGTNTALPDCTSNDPGVQASCSTGYSNTVLLAGLGASYQAATYCHNLSAHGHTDWYLPSQNELQAALSATLGPNPPYDFGPWYWSSSERGASAAWDQDPGGDEQLASSKQDWDLVRCVRKDN